MMGRGVDGIGGFSLLFIQRLEVVLLGLNVDATRFFLSIFFLHTCDLYHLCYRAPSHRHCLGFHETRICRLRSAI